MKYLVGSIILVFLILLFDIGNPDALRQGTEGFYLQVASEMFNKSSLLTPYYLDSPHWSKPPLLFLLPQPLYGIVGFAGLFASRVSVLILSLFLTAIAARKFGQITSARPSTYFLFLFSSVGFFKYSRIFMMEIPLLLLCFLCAIYFFSYLERKKISNFWLAVLFAVLSCQVKGPVSFVMLFPSFLAYGIYHFVVFKKLFIKEIFLWFTISLALSSGWFFHQYYNFGQDFFDYFFLRENLGKFSSKSYPMTNVLQGLLLYALPWSLLVPAFIWKLKKYSAEKLSNESSKFLAFLLVCFFCFFTLWLIPSQRSHHYAMPAAPFFLSLIYMEFFKLDKVSVAVRRVIQGYTLFFTVIGFMVVAFTFINIDQFAYSSTTLLVSGGVLLLISLLLAFRKKSKAEHFYISSILLLSVYWSLFIPNYILPLVPNEARELTADIKNIGAAHRKPYFISRSLQREVDVLSIDAVGNYLKKESSAVVINERLFLLLDKRSNYRILKDWDVWKRGIQGPAIWRNLKDKTINKLRTKMYLISLD